MINEAAENAWMNRMRKIGAVKFHGHDEDTDTMSRYIRAHTKDGKETGRFDRMNNKEVVPKEVHEATEPSHKVGDSVWMRTDKKWFTKTGKVTNVGRTHTEVEHKDGTKSNVPHSMVSHDFPYKNPYAEEREKAAKNESVLSFKSWINEAENKSTSDTNGKIHEVLVAHNLNGGKFINADHKKAHDDLAKTLGGTRSERYKDEVKKAHTASEGIRSKIGDKGITRVGWTSQPGAIREFTKGKHDVSQHEDPSDVMIEHHNGDYTGVSLKSTTSHSAKPGFSNEGRAKVDKRLGVNTDSHIKNAKQEIVNKRSEFSGMTDAAAKAHIKSNPKLAKEMADHGSKVLEKVRDDWHGAYSKIQGTKEHADHLRNIIHAGPTEIPHLKSSTSGTNGDHRNSVISPEEHYSSMLNDHKNLSVEKSGNDSISHVHTDPKTKKRTVIARERAKWASTPLASPIKTAVM